MSTLNFPQMNEEKLTYRETYEGEILLNYRNDGAHPWIFNYGHIQSGNKDVYDSRSSIFITLPRVANEARWEMDISVVASRTRDRLEVYLDDFPIPRWEIKETTDGIVTIGGPIQRNGNYPLELRYITDELQSAVDNVARVHEIRIYEMLPPDPFTEGDISKIPLGSKIKIGKGSDGEDLFFSVVSKDHHSKDSNYPENSVTLLSDSSVFSSKYYVEGDENTKYFWSPSFVRSWLNYIFYNSMNDSIKNAILDTDVKYGWSGWIHDEDNGITRDKVFIPSTTELGLSKGYVGSYNNYEYGTQFPYKPVNIGEEYWLRDAYHTLNDEVKRSFHQLVDETGEQRTQRTDYEKGIRPALNIRGTARVRLVEGTDYFEFDIREDEDEDEVEQGIISGKIKNNYIYVLNPETLEVEQIVDNYESFSLTINYNYVGDFIGQINNRLENATSLSKGKIVLYGGHGALIGIITNINLTIDEEGRETRIVKGKSLGHILSYRVIEKEDGQNRIQYTGRAEDLMKSIVRMNLVDTSDRRKIKNFEIGESKELGEFIYGNFLYDNILDVIEDTSQTQDLGWHVLYDEGNKKMIFDVYEGVNHSISQDENEPVLLSVDLGNLESQSYLYDEFNHKNHVYAEFYSSLWSDSPSTWSQSGDEDAKGINRKETYAKLDLYRPDLVSPTNPEFSIPAELQMQWVLDDHKPLESFDGRVIDGQIFDFGVDYNLGDIITVRDNDWTMEADLRVISVTIESTPESKDFEIILTFGDKVPRVIDRVKSEIEDFDSNKNTVNRNATVEELKEVERRLRNLINGN